LDEVLSRTITKLRLDRFSLVEERTGHAHLQSNLAHALKHEALGGEDGHVSHSRRAALDVPHELFECGGVGVGNVWQIASCVGFWLLQICRLCAARQPRVLERQTAEQVEKSRHG